jgi:uncharacterized DUF497 family protein
MDAPTFEWDLAKAVANIERHGVSFPGGVAVFQDALAKVHPDPAHSESEPRGILIWSFDPGSTAARGVHRPAG